MTGKVIPNIDLPSLQTFRTAFSPAPEGAQWLSMIRPNATAIRGAAGQLRQSRAGDCPDTVFCRSPNYTSIKRKPPDTAAAAAVCLWTSLCAPPWGIPTGFVTTPLKTTTLSTIAHESDSAMPSVLSRLPTS